jgi:hypothetical protein
MQNIRLKFNWYPDWWTVSERERLRRLVGYRWEGVRWINFVRKA